MPSRSTQILRPPKPREVAAETKKLVIPLVKEKFCHFEHSSILYQQPLSQTFGHPPSLVPPYFQVLENEDPVDFALGWAASSKSTIAFICPCNGKKAGGDWEIDSPGYEESLCRRSTLSATLSSPESGNASSFPVPSEGGIFSKSVVVFRGPPNEYEKWAPEKWGVLPVISVPPQYQPRLTQDGTKCSFVKESEIMKSKLRAALTICVCNDISNVVIGDFGLGKKYRNPPQQLANLWREVLLYDPVLRGRIQKVAFIFSDSSQSTSKLILDGIAKKDKRQSGISSILNFPTDHEIFQAAFSPEGIQRFLSQPDSRLSLGRILE